MKYPQLVPMPSAVSDWLKEQLKARGFESELYARLLLSLLHVHTRDLIHPEDPYSSPPAKKDGGRSVAGHRRVRRAAQWWKNARLDPEQVKRSAAVECLMSAADQNCEVESLVDELCAKLKEVDSENSTLKISNKPTEDCNKIVKPQKVSTKELAEKYYAAFPPLNQKEGYITSNINLVVGKWPSPEKNLDKIDLITAARWTPGSPKKSKKKPKQRQTANEPNMKLSRNNNRNRLGYKKANCARNLHKEMNCNVTNWDIYNNNNNNYSTKDRYTLPPDQPIVLSGTPAQAPQRAPDLLRRDLECFFDDGNLEQLRLELLEAAKFADGLLQTQSNVSLATPPSSHSCSVCRTPNNRKDPLRPWERATRESAKTGTIHRYRLFGHVVGGMEYDNGRSKVPSDDYYQHGDHWYRYMPSVSGINHPKSYAYLDNLRKFAAEACNLEYEERSRTVTMNLDPLRSAFARYQPSSPIYILEDDCYILAGPQPYSRKFGRPVRGPPLPEHVKPKSKSPTLVTTTPGEDMWGSAELYFRPIVPAREEYVPARTIYPDGTTFPVNYNFDKLCFEPNRMYQLYVDCNDGEQKMPPSYRSESTVFRGAFDKNQSSTNTVTFEIKQHNKATQTINTEYVGLLATVDSLYEKRKEIDSWDASDLSLTYKSSMDNMLNDVTVSELEELAGMSCDDDTVRHILGTLLDDKVGSSVENQGQSYLRKIWDNENNPVHDMSNIRSLKEESRMEGELLLKEIAQHQILNNSFDGSENSEGSVLLLDEACALVTNDSYGLPADDSYAGPDISTPSANPRALYKDTLGSREEVSALLENESSSPEDEACVNEQSERRNAENPIYQDNLTLLDDDYDLPDLANFLASRYWIEYITNKR